MTLMLRHNKVDLLSAVECDRRGSVGFGSYHRVPHLAIWLVPRVEHGFIV